VRFLIDISCYPERNPGAFRDLVFQHGGVSADAKSELFCAMAALVTQTEEQDHEIRNNHGSTPTSKPNKGRDLYHSLASISRDKIANRILGLTPKFPRR
jgi:hypothetical protein